MNKTLSFAFVLLLASPAYAATIDFRTSAFAAAEGHSTYSTTTNGVGITISAAPAEQGAEIEHSSSGLGIDYRDTYGAAERQIEGVEVLTIQFDQLVEISELTATNLFNWGIIQIEVGTYTIDGTTTSFVAQNINGRLTVPVNAGPTTTISFRASGDWTGWRDNGFTLETLSFSTVSSVTEVPELDPGAAPAALALVAGSTLLLSERRRSRA